MGHLSEGMWIAAVRHTKMVEQFVDGSLVRGNVASALESVLGRSLTEAFRVDDVDERVAEFLMPDERLLCVEKSSMTVYVLILGLPSG
jgi:hypothetical protein